MSASVFTGVQYNVVADPGTGTAIPVTQSCFIAFSSAAAETNTIANPSFIGQQISLYMVARVVGDRVITAASAINQATNTIMTFGAAADWITLIAVGTNGAGTTLRWRVLANDGVALS